MTYAELRLCKLWILIAFAGQPGHHRAGRGRARGSQSRSRIERFPAVDPAAPSSCLRAMSTCRVVGMRTVRTPGRSSWRRVNPKGLVIHCFAASPSCPAAISRSAAAQMPSAHPGSPRSQLEGIPQLGRRHGHGQVPGLVSPIPAAEQGQQVLIFENAAGFLDAADQPPVLDLPDHEVTPKAP